MSGAIQNSATVIVGPSAGANLTAPSQWDFLAEWRHDGHPEPVELQIATALQRANSLAAAGFPPERQFYGQAGAYGGSAATNWSDPPGINVLLRIELGSGLNSRTLYADCKPGRFSLGSQERVRVSVARWLADDPNGDSVRVSAGIAPADGSGGYLTYTVTSYDVPAGTFKGLEFPPGATWFELYSAGDWFAYQAVNDTMYVGRYANVYPPSYTPPSSPLPVVMPSVQFQNDSGFDITLTVVVWLQ